MADPKDEVMEVTEELPEAEEPTAEETAAPEMPEGAGIKHSVMDIPELSDKKVGDTIVLSIQEISPDGETYTLIPVGEEGAPSASPGAGREAVASELLGGGEGA